MIRRFGFGIGGCWQDRHIVIGCLCRRPDVLCFDLDLVRHLLSGFTAALGYRAGIVTRYPPALGGPRIVTLRRYVGLVGVAIGAGRLLLRIDRVKLSLDQRIEAIFGTKVLGILLATGFAGDEK